MRRKNLLLLTIFSVLFRQQHAIPPAEGLTMPSSSMSLSSGTPTTTADLPPTYTNDNNVVDMTSSTVAAPAITTSYPSAHFHPTTHQPVATTMLGWYNSYRTSLDTNPLATKMITGAVIAVLGDAVAQATTAAANRKDSDDISNNNKSKLPLAIRLVTNFDYKRAISFAAFYSVFRGIQHVLYPPMFQAFRGQYILKLMEFICTRISMVPIVLQSLELSTSTSSFHAAATLGGVGVGCNIFQASSFAAIEQALVSQLVIIPFIYYPLFYTFTSIVQGLTFAETITRVKSTFIPVMKKNLIFWIPLQYITFKFVAEPLQIPVLTVLGLVWTVILSLFAGSAKKQQQAPVPAVAAASAATAKAAAVAAESSDNRLSTIYTASKLFTKRMEQQQRKSSSQKERPFTKTVPLWFKK